ncbi:hypothetical protein AMAG_12347 [Allomyces macrogynus ATCC 38327]|uniref:U2A'/phosphoprotein 32 family A C-terminal domain-containing protein n=1 Tax=Allomyces macrogynus (strain ATCC 38327) TaxID=578462 RepID=A0A0L0SXJ2_ALLM3|nr:hypothetical protein AMAG_12347 [Allomyces macrogynus ATCC 38327]|eukprot:KNE67283.1 hypothetical protein AMAG_12347 [Allomyces macrogynus ATCC 38327]
MVKLTPVFIADHVLLHVQDIKDLALVGKEIDEIDDLSACISLAKLSLKQNALTNDALDGLSHNEAITTLDLSCNKLESFAGLDKLRKLISINVASNEITRLSTHLLQLKNLKALVANGNMIAKIDNLANCTQLNTLVLSHNKLTDLSNLGALKHLTKLSASHNPIRVIPDLSANAQLKDLRLSHCKITAIPESIRLNPALETIDLGSNLITQFTDIVHLASLPNLHQLTLRGNPVCNEPDYEAKVKALFPSLRILDNVRFDERFLKNKKKREALVVKRKREEERAARRAAKEAAAAASAASGPGSDPGDEGEDKMDVDAPAPLAAAGEGKKRPRTADAQRRLTRDGGDKPHRRALPRVGSVAGARGSPTPTLSADDAAVDPPAAKRFKGPVKGKGPAATTEGGTRGKSFPKSGALGEPLSVGTMRGGKGAALGTKSTAPAKVVEKAAAAPAKAAAESAPAPPTPAPVAQPSNSAPAQSAPAAATATTAVPPEATLSGVRGIIDRRKRVPESQKKEVVALLEKKDADGDVDMGLGIGGWD